eukprot:INCI7176.2.p1 GENE.INCI7176.2~~INCI7176.2.p1  ORF type:complete len:1382 (+),score=156.99 INCI7176.2:85-4230(+)
MAAASPTVKQHSSDDREWSSVLEDKVDPVAALDRQFPDARYFTSTLFESPFKLGGKPPSAAAAAALDSLCDFRVSGQAAASTARTAQRQKPASGEKKDNIETECAEDEYRSGRRCPAFLDGVSLVSEHEGKQRVELEFSEYCSRLINSIREPACTTSPTLSCFDNGRRNAGIIVAVVGRTGSGKSAYLNALRCHLRESCSRNKCNKERDPVTNKPGQPAAAQGKEQDNAGRAPRVMVVDCDQSSCAWEPRRAVISHFIARHRNTASASEQNVVPPSKGTIPTSGNASAAMSKSPGQQDSETTEVATASAHLTSVGLNSVPSWCAPYHTLSTGERYRAFLARVLQDVSEAQKVAAKKWKCVDRLASAKPEGSSGLVAVFMENFAAHLDRINARTCANSFAKFVKAGTSTTLKAAVAPDDSCNMRSSFTPPQVIYFVACAHMDVVRHLNPHWVVHTQRICDSEGADMNTRWSEVETAHCLDERGNSKAGADEICAMKPQKRFVRLQHYANETYRRRIHLTVQVAASAVPTPNGPAKDTISGGVHVAARTPCSPDAQNCNSNCASIIRAKRRKHSRVCPRCDRSFSTRGMFVKHLRKRHKLSPAEVAAASSVPVSASVSSDQKEASISEAQAVGVRLPVQAQSDASACEPARPIKHPNSPLSQSGDIPSRKRCKHSPQNSATLCAPSAMFGMRVVECRRFQEHDAPNGLILSLATASLGTTNVAEGRPTAHGSVGKASSTRCQACTSKQSQNESNTTGFRFRHEDEIRPPGLDVLVQPVDHDRGVALCDRLFDRQFRGIVATAVPRFRLPCRHTKKTKVQVPSTVSPRSQHHDSAKLENDKFRHANFGVGVILGPSGSLKSVVAARYFGHFAWVPWVPSVTRGTSVVSPACETSPQQLQFSSYSTMKLCDLFAAMCLSPSERACIASRVNVALKLRVARPVLALLCRRMHLSLAQVMQCTLGSLSGGEQSIVDLALLVEGRAAQLMQKPRSTTMPDRTPQSRGRLQPNPALRNGIVVDEFTSLLDRSLAAELASCLTAIIARHQLTGIVLVGCQVDDLLGTPSPVLRKSSSASASSGSKHGMGVHQSLILAPDWVFSAGDRFLYSLQRYFNAQSTRAETERGANNTEAVMLAAGVGCSGHSDVPEKQCASTEYSCDDLLLLGTPLGDNVSVWLELLSAPPPFRNAFSTEHQALHPFFRTLRISPCRLLLRLSRCNPDLWRHFRHHHYKTPNLSPSAETFVLRSMQKRDPEGEDSNVLFSDEFVGFVATIRHNRKRLEGQTINPRRAHRTVVLPSWQGLGIGSCLSDAAAEIVRLRGGDYFGQTVHPRFGGYRDRSPLWAATPWNHSVAEYRTENWRQRNSNKRIRLRVPKFIFSHQYDFFSVVV